jgi:hypothetical protein
MGFIYSGFAQTPYDGLMMPKGQICIAGVYENSSWTHYWEGNFLRNNDNIGTFHRVALMPMIVGGISDKVNFIVSLPYVQTQASQGQMAGAEGIQDLGISLKAQLLDKSFGKGKLTAFSNLSFSTPASNYQSDYMPFSLGFGTNELGLRTIGQFELDKGPYLRVSMSYLHRGTTEAERDFYFSERAYYTSTMDVPDAIHSHFFLGSWFLENKLRIEAGLTSFRCASGDDIRVYNMPQPTNKVDFDRVEGFAQYYLKGNGGLGFMAYYNHMFSGRNMGQFSGYGLGLIYQFKAF